ncbi:DUF4397 domain-containing protein [Haloarcula sediminis]|uniref:DUF4397 domain-containing protein n=1 Tax=Haloarcula sediminis TaxID=3111777 RepID=UPI002D78C7C2|nr:DUF4397 domain-containing protein [Haloarcula sp. CK38]
MTDETTRRRVIQGAGIVGITGIVGGAGAAQESPTPTEGATALRVAHASPDAPPVSVRLDDETIVESLEFGTVTDYQTVAPDAYRLRVVAAEGGGGFLGGLLDGVLDSNQDGGTVLYDAEITVEEGTTYTAAAYGEVGQGAGETPTDSTPTAEVSATPDGNMTPITPAGTATPQQPQMGTDQTDPLVQGLAFGESATATVPEGDYRLLIRPVDEEPTPGSDMTPTPEDGATPTPEGGSTPAEPGTPADTGTLQVTLLEDDPASPPEGEARLSVFHAVPDIGPVNIVAMPQDSSQDDGQGRNGSQPQAPPLSADVTLEAGTVYSAFAVGYADPEAAAEATPTDGSTPGTPTDGSPTGTPATGEPPGFDLLVAETATDGERVQGGS